jgi:hypothetical protein
VPFHEEEVSFAKGIFNFIFREFFYLRHSIRP